MNIRKFFHNTFACLMHYNLDFLHPFLLILSSSSFLLFYDIKASKNKA